jgi:acyl carrier protein
MRQATVDRATFQEVRAVLRDVLRLGARAERLTRATQLLGGLPELDSMAVITVIGALEERFGITVADDEISADTFATVGALADFVNQKLAR